MQLTAAAIVHVPESPEHVQSAVPSVAVSIAALRMPVAHAAELLAHILSAVEPVVESDAESVVISICRSFIDGKFVEPGGRHRWRRHGRILRS